MSNMLNYIFAQRNAYGVAQRKIAQIFRQEGGYTLEELLMEEECLINQISAQNPKLIEYLCQRDTLKQLIKYSTRFPTDPNNADKAHKFPFVASNVLNSNQTICQAMLEGGWQQEAEEEEQTEEANADNESNNTDEATAVEVENKTPEAVEAKEETEQTKEETDTDQSKEFKEASTDLNNAVQDALDKDIASQETDATEDAAKKECLVEEIDAEVEADAEAETEDNDEKKEEVVEKKEDDDEFEREEENVEEGADKSEGPGSIKVSMDNVNNYMAEEQIKTEEAEEESKTAENFAPKHDYTIMEELMEFLEVPEESPENDSRLEPILCGYFTKVITALLQKQKGKTLEFLLLVQKGKIFDNLLCHMQHFSLATLMLTLLGMKFFIEDYTGYGNVSTTRTSSLIDWDNGSSDDADQPTAANTERSSADAAEAESRFNEMNSILNQKKLMVARTLLQQMSKLNQTDIEKTLNASTVLQDLVENESCFKLLVTDGHLELMIQIACEGQANAMNAPYIKHLLSNVINQYCQRTKDFYEVSMEEFKESFRAYFNDLVFTQIMTLRSADSADDEYINQSGAQIKKIGQDRIRSMELLRTIFSAMNKHFLKNGNPDAEEGAEQSPQEDNGKPLLSTILRRHVSDTMLYMLKTFPFSCISHQQVIIIMTGLRESYDQEDLANLKRFVRVELEGQARFQFPGSANQTSGMNMGQIIQIAQGIRNITQAEIDEQSSEEEASDEEGLGASSSTVSMAETTRRAELFEWMRFCKEKIEPYDKIWNKRLEDTSEDEKEDSEDDDGVISISRKKSQMDEEEDTENMVKDILKMANNRRTGVVKKSPGEAADIRAQIASGNDDDDDDSPYADKGANGDKMTNSECANNVFWTKPDQLSFEDIDMDDF